MQIFFFKLVWEYCQKREISKEVKQTNNIKGNHNDNIQWKSRVVIRKLL